MNSFYTLRCKSLSGTWLDGFPIGNGRHGAMVWGDDEDIVSLNHEWLWRGVTRQRDTEKVPDGVLKQVRALLDKEDYFKGTIIANAWFGGEGGVSGTKNRIDSFQPAGDLRFALSGAESTGTRTLDMLCGIAETTRKRNGQSDVTFTCYADVIEDAIVCRWSAEEPFSGNLRLERPEDSGAMEETAYFDTRILYSCQFQDGISYRLAVDVQCDGAVAADKTGICVKDATYFLATAKIRVCPENENAPYPEMRPYAYETMKQAHCDLFSKEMQRFDLKIDCAEPSGFLEDCLENMRAGEEDDGMLQLFYNYGKYLFLSSNLTGELPAHLQGIWNRDVAPPWGSDYHFNINLQMNYWMAEPMGLSYGIDALMRLLTRFMPHGKKAAMDLYGCSGIWLPHATDVWGRATPEAYGYAVWLGAAPWFARYFWERYLYSGDTALLKTRIYPFLKEVARFFEDYVVEKNGTYEIYPSQSPENRFVGVGSIPVAACKSSAMDVQLVYDALGYAISAAEILGVDQDDAAKWKEIRCHLPEFKIGTDGRLLEWNQELEEAEPGHRHISHLYGLYPSDIFTEEKRPKQFDAARKSLEFRMAQGGGHTGWSRAWTACFYARLGEGDKVYEHVSQLVRQYTTNSLLDTHPYPSEPPFVFQIDGNFGTVAAMNEAVVQYKNDKLYLLPALPQRWQKGSVKGLCTPGGHSVDFSWEDGKIKTFTAKLGYGGNLTVVVNGTEMVLTGTNNEITKTFS